MCKMEHGFSNFRKLGFVKKGHVVSIAILDEHRRKGFGSVLVKPDVSFIKSKPFIYEDSETYIAVNYDWQNLEEKIDYVLDNFDWLRKYLVDNMRARYTEEYQYSKIALHLYDIFRNISSVSTETTTQRIGDLL